jgi:dipeptidyl aminopeptidase/acylaminoacyl peptidase
MTLSRSPNDGYQLPPKPIVDIIDAPPEPSVLISPDGRHMLLIKRDALPDIADLARPMDRLAGLRIDPQSNTRFQSAYRRGLLYQRIATALQNPGTQVAEKITAQPQPIDVARLLLKPTDAPDEKHEPVQPKIGLVKWSHNNHNFVFTLLTSQGTALYAADVDRLLPTLIHPNISRVLNGVNWMPCGTQVVFSAVPEHHRKPVAPVAPIGPRIQQSTGETSPTRTYQDLLKTPYDEELFQFYATTETVIADVSGVVLHRWPPAMYANVSPAPDGVHFLVKRLKRPFSYLLNWYQFAMTVDVFSVHGKRLCQIADIPVAENIPIEGVRTQPRMIHWMSSRPSTVCYTVALDGGDPNAVADFRDHVFIVEGPFDAHRCPTPRPLMRLPHRHYGMTYFADPNQMIATQYDRDRRWVSDLLYDVSASTLDPIVITDRSIRDKYNDPGRIIERADATGHYIVDRREDRVFRAGVGATEQGNRPFLDQQNLKTLKSERLWQCDPKALESVVKLQPEEVVTDVPETPADSSSLVWLTSHQTPTSPPNLWARTHSVNVRLNARVQLTNFDDPTPQIRGIKKEIVTYNRSDGVQLSATLYLPANHKPGQRLPLLVWAYPMEFNDPSTAGQVSGSSQQFTRMVGISHLTLVTQGYAVLDNATMPVIGDPETMNDTFIQQIVDAAQAAVDFAVDRGVADRERVAVGGHSYGAFMTANLLAHCDIFKAGIARSGAYNRTLTPFGFQSERRSYWEAKSIYHNISPFMFANQIVAPLLIMHGEKDNNPGTFPLQSERLYQAIKGNGGSARLVVLPHESHGYIAQQSVLHTQAEMIQWLDKYIK